MRDYADQINSIRLCAESDDPVDECCWEDCNQHHGSRDNMCRQKIMMDAADAIEELLAAVPKWISVEKPPDNGRNIFICHGSADFKAPCIGHYEPNMKRFYEDKNWFASPIYDAMYWCEMPELPLPGPPKEVE